ncbi:Bug family tripartite tricarboxylate transporter substrate binding protein [Bradyrhizobium sp. UFLA05-112]
MRISRLLSLAIWLLCYLAASGALLADDYPVQPIKIIIPNPPGGPGDVIARAFTERAARIVGKPFVYDYRPGASTMIGMTAAAKAEPDGYTIVGLPSSAVGAVAIRKTARYNIETDFRPIAGIGSVPLVLVVRSGLKFGSMDDFIAGARKGNLTFGSGGVGTIGHLTSLLLLNDINGKATHVPFRGNPDVLQAILGAHIDFGIVSVADAAPFIDSAELQFLAVTANTHVAAMPNVPTMKDVGLPNVDAKLWYAFLAPRNTDPNRLMKLYKSFADAADDPLLQQQIKSLGFNVEIRNPQELANMMKTELARWKRVIEANNVPFEE